MRLSSRYDLIFALACAAAPLAAAAAAEERETFIPDLVLLGERNDGMWLYGQLNKGVLVYDDGEETDAYPLVDNANSSTRFGLWFKSRWADDLTFMTNVEFEWNPYSTGAVNRLDDGVDLRDSNWRKIEAIFETSIGTLWVGQGSMASDGTSEVDFSGTGVVGYSSIGDSAGGQLFTFSNGGISGVSVGSAFSNFDGLSRKMRARYDTGDLLGDKLQLRTSIGYDALGGDEQVQYDVAAVYVADGNADWDLAGALAYSRPDDDTNAVNGSVSALHVPSGLNGTLAAGGRDTRGRSPAFLYVKLGWRSADLLPVGGTAFALDWYGGDEVNTADSESMSVGFSAVQSFAYYRTDLYATVRWYDYDDGSANYNDGLAFLTGARIAF